MIVALPRRAGVSIFVLMVCACLWLSAESRAKDLTFTLVPNRASPATAIAYSDNGNLIATAGGLIDATIKIWDARTARLLRVILADGGSASMLPAVASVVITPDEKWVISGGSDGGVYVWNTSTGAKYATLKEADDVENAFETTDVAVSRDGRIVAASDSNAVRIFSLENKKLIRSIEGGGLNSPEFRRHPQVRFSAVSRTRRATAFRF